LFAKLRDWIRKTKAHEAACTKAATQFGKDHPDLYLFTAKVHTENSERFTIVVRYGTGDEIRCPPPYKIYYVSNDLSRVEETQDKIELPRFRSSR
jgi:hypothetical protein